MPTTSGSGLRDLVLTNIDDAWALLDHRPEWSELPALSLPRHQDHAGNFCHQQSHDGGGNQSPEKRLWPKGETHLQRLRGRRHAASRVGSAKLRAGRKTAPAFFRRVFPA